MKKIRTPFLLAMLLLFAQSLRAQECSENHTQAAWASAKGYWVVQSSKRKPKEALVFYYNNQHQLIGRQEINNQRLKLHKKKTLLQLKAMLEDAIARHEKASPENEAVVLRSPQQE